ncbi:MAG: (Fe-S)-binding protein [Methylovulum sp.]|uniref:(Fe-S)-binding protein n=1 Tax=Methylovulum sp. TaxID=1916980 RepID=UPI0026029DBB|nr:(Fe-S)-binding protein [Methylovulum sp.]MDD2723580.1 (Fe-S)-binding protein [Methylovulum sp.]MDD5126066.1 (Fe-S)-binding protein [Methylovulum sp.]
MNDLLKDADLCVKCGLCLPHCPTYTHTQNENESPRGRIALIQAWAGQKLASSEKLVEHIDNCLLCRSCERVCPAVVPYSRLIDNFRNQIQTGRKSSVRVSLIKKVAHNQNARRLLQKSLRFYQTSHLQSSARWLKLPQLLGFQPIERLLPETKQPAVLANFYPASGEKHGNVGLFVGCMGAWLDQKTIHAAIQVLTTVGCDVYLPKQQTCCGALALHDGDQTIAAQLAEDNVRSFGGLELDAIISIASGCGSQLREYSNSGFAGKVMDISQFLSQFASDLSKRLKPLPKTVCVHTPCSLKNVLRSEQSVFKLLGQIPGLTLAPLPETVQCCGSAGSYMLDHPKMAQTLLNDVLESVLQKQPDILVSSNMGCALHIAAGLRERGIKLDVVHPVVLVAGQL